MRWRRCVRPRSRHAPRRLFRELAQRGRGLLRKMPIKAGRAACGSSCRLLGTAGELFENGAAELLQLAELRQVVLKFLVEKLRVLRAELVAKNHVAQLDGVGKEGVFLQFLKGGGGVVMVHGGSWPKVIAGLYPLGDESGTRQGTARSPAMAGQSRSVSIFPVIAAGKGGTGTAGLSRRACGAAPSDSPTKWNCAPISLANASAW